MNKSDQARSNPARKAPHDATVVSGHPAAAAHRPPTARSGSEAPRGAVSGIRCQSVEPVPARPRASGSLPVALGRGSVRWDLSSMGSFASTRPRAPASTGFRACVRSHGSSPASFRCSSRPGSRPAWLHYDMHRWRYALPETPIGEACLWDAGPRSGRVWRLVPRGPRRSVIRQRQRARAANAGR